MLCLNTLRRCVTVSSLADLSIDLCFHNLAFRPWQRLAQSTYTPPAVRTSSSANRRHKKPTEQNARGEAVALGHDGCLLGLNSLGNLRLDLLGGDDHAYA